MTPTEGPREWPDPRAFWRERRVIVTGGAGFLGSALTRVLAARGARDMIVPRRADYDLRHGEAIDRLLRDTARAAGGRPRPADVVIHLAALVGGIGANRARPAEFFYDNVMMSVPLLHECWRRGVGKFVAVGTVCAYPRDTRVPFREDDLWQGYPEETNAPYGLAKKMLLVQSAAYRQQYGFASIFLLPTNLYGPGAADDPEASHVIPALIRKFLDAQARGADHVVAWGDGSPTREFLYVDDAAEAVALAAERYDASDPVNVGAGSETTIRDLAERIARLTGFTGRIEWDTSRPNGQPRRRLDTERAERAFGFRARTALDEGLRRTVAAYRSRR